MAILFPTEQEMPNSSLAHYLALARAGVRHRRQPHAFVGPARHGRRRRCAAACARPSARASPARCSAPVSASCTSWTNSRASGEPSACRRAAASWTPAATRAIRASCRWRMFYAGLSATFGVPRAALHQHVRHDRAEHAALRRRQRGRSLGQVGAALAPLPRWSTRCPAAKSRAASAACWCTATSPTSIPSTTILTEDVGVAVDGGFLLLGRAEGAQAKGCSLAVQEFLQAARHERALDGGPPARAGRQRWPGTRWLRPRRAALEVRVPVLQPRAAGDARAPGAEPQAAGIWDRCRSRRSSASSTRRRAPARSADPYRREALRLLPVVSGYDAEMVRLASTVTSSAFARRSCIASSPRTSPTPRCSTNSSRP